MTEQPANDARADVEAIQEPAEAAADVETAPISETDTAPTPVVSEVSEATENVPDEVQLDTTGFQLNTSDVVALVNERSAEKMTVSTFRTLVAHDQAPQPLVWGRTPLWSFATIEDWITDMFASGLFTAPLVADDSTSDHAAEPEQELIFGSTAQWVERFLVPMYRRNIAPNGSDQTWCPQWWEHAEAIIRLEALWRAWEHLRLDGKTGMSVFMKDHLDHHMPVLLDGKGPFDGCSLNKGHEAVLKPFTLVTAPTELFPDARQPTANPKES